jgi:hypothetical protein
MEKDRRNYRSADRQQDGKRDQHIDTTAVCETEAEIDRLG